ncbi:MAG TPA: DciA family protein [Patescibacteria group bacterium]|nr:DciA family protein [Patescibacteria group bacterium]
MTTGNRPRPLSDLVPGLTKDIFGKKNLLFGKMVSQWLHIVGPEVAAHTLPVELKFQRKAEKEKGGTPQAVLLLGVQPAFALEFSYQKNLLVERLNAFFGYPAIKDIKIVQDSSIMDKPVAKPVKTKPVSLQQQQAIDAVTADIKDNDLQTALKNLGKAIASRKE